jgi:hypothetical protein
MINWLPPIPLTGRVEFPGLFESSVILVSIHSPIPPVWRKAGYLRVELLLDGEFVTDSYQPIDFGQSRITIPIQPYRLSFDPVRDLAIIYPNTFISIYPLSPSEVQNTKMSGSYDPGNRAVGPDSSVTIAAAVTNTVLAAANLARTSEGYILNNSNKNLWITFTGTAATTAPPATKILPNGGNWDIPGNYTGVINGIWEAGATGSCVVHEFSYV